jgi:LAS superfamily LD-carboxypeptidase LdcB
VTSSRISVIVARGAAACAIAASIVSPVQPAQAQEHDSGSNDQSRRDNALVELDIDVLRVDNTQVEDALGDINANVDAQTAAVANAQTALTDAETALAAAQTAVDEAQTRLNALTAATDEVVIDAFMNPPVESGFDAFSAASLTDMSVKQSILQTKATSDAATLGMYEEARDQLEIETAAREEAAANATSTRSAAEAALADLESALSQQAQFVIAVEQRIDQRLGEAASLARLDPALAQQITARETALAGSIASVQQQVQADAARQQAAELAAQAETQRGYGTIKDPPGGVVTVNCPGGGTIDIAGDIAGPLQRLLDDAAAAGVGLCGGGFRDPNEQIALRRSNCGNSNYLIYQAPSSACSPPTARPGSSMHEQGLAIDFTCNGGGTVSRSGECFIWLDAHAADYGLYNLPSESWHWSVNGN